MKIEAIEAALCKDTTVGKGPVKSKMGLYSPRKENEESGQLSVLGSSLLGERDTFTVLDPEDNPVYLYNCPFQA